MNNQKQPAAAQAASSTTMRQAAQDAPQQQLPNFTQPRGSQGRGANAAASPNSVYSSHRNTSTKQKHYKVICVGESMVGKTSLIQRYISNVFHEHGTQPTLSWDFKVKSVQLGEGEPHSSGFQPSQLVKMYIWDTAGQERYRQIARMYYNEVCGAFVCFDLTEEDSFQAVNFWLQDLSANAPKNIVKILVGLKLDLVEKIPGDFSEKRESDVLVRRGVTTEQAQLFAQRNKMFYMEVSAKTGHNVEQAFYKMAYEVHQTSRAERGGSRDRNGSGRGNSSRGSSEDNVMQDRVKLRSTTPNKYASANEVPTGLHDSKKKKCCN